MRLLITYRNVLRFLALAGGLVLNGDIAQAVTLNFSAVLMPGTCTFSLDKSTLQLGTTSLRELTPSTVVRAQPFTLSVQNCSGTDLNLMPVINVSGEGVTQDGRWLFRASDSAVRGVGVMLVKTNTPPSYSATEVKNNDDIVLATKGVNPTNQNLTFYAAMTCGSTGCASLQAGVLTARVMFTLAYR